MLEPPGRPRPLARVLVLLAGCVLLLSCGDAPVLPGARPQTNAATAAGRPHIDAKGTPTASGPQSYLACGCGCCVSDTLKPRQQCLFRSKGDDLARIIAEDRRMAANTKMCAVVGCSAGTEYMYCDE